LDVRGDSDSYRLRSVRQLRDLDNRIHRWSVGQHSRSYDGAYAQ
jgi:hypothetical protein